MTAFLSRRLFIAMATILTVSILLFVTLELDAEAIATRVLGPYSSDEQRAIWLERNGYNEPLLLRYFDWLFGLFRGDFGQSFIYRRPVNEILWDRLGNTAILGGTALLMIAILGLFLGLLAGANEGRLLDRIISLTSVLTTSVPEFATAVFVSAIFVFSLGWLPGTSGMATGFDIKQLILPVMVLVIYDFGYIARLTRASMAEVMRENYIRTARLKGVSRRGIIFRHAMRNALIAPYTVLVLQINWLLSGVIVVEFFFAYKGFGVLLLEATLNQDIFLIQACAFVAVLAAVLSQLVSDLGYVLLNPRIRVS